MEKSEFLMGIDDAGRGPIIGPMILAGVIIKKEDEKKLKELGVTDSKKLLPEKREELGKFLKENFRFCYEITEADEIDLRNKVGTNLNRIEALKSAKIINRLMKSHENQEIIEVIIDCPSPNTENWRNCVLTYIEEKYKDKINLKTEHKADFNHLCCSAASIIAKTTRDAEIEKLKNKFNLDFGSGYCSDPVTIECLEKSLKQLVSFGLVRKTWSTFSDFKAKKEQKKLF